MASFLSWSTNKTGKLKLLLWKNYIIEKRRPWVILFEFLLPVIIPLVLVAVRATVEVENYPLPTYYRAFPLSIPPDSRNSVTDSITCSNWKIAFSPSDNKEAGNIINDVIARLPCILQEAIPFADEDDLEYVLSLNGSSTDNILCAVVFDSLTSETTDYKLRFPYKLRASATSSDWETESLYPDDNSNGPRNPSFGIAEFNVSDVFPEFKTLFPNYSETFSANDFGGLPSYYLEKFLMVQASLDAVIMDRLGVPDVLDLTILVQRFSFPPYDDDSFVTTLQDFLGNLFLLSFVFITFNIIKSVVTEKEKRLKESMKIMGLENYLHWSAWFVQYSLFTLIISALTTLFLTVKFTEKVLPGSDASLIFVFVSLYGLSSMMLCFLLSTMFSKANVASVIGTLVWFVTFLPWLILYNSYNDLSLGVKVFACLLCNTGMGLGANIIGEFEVMGVGAQWDLIAEPSTKEDNISLLAVLGMLTLDMFIYGSLAWYIEAVFPGDFGYPQPFYFFLQKSYWFGSADVAERQTEAETDCDSDFIEEEPEGVPKGIKITGLRKVFGDKVAVNNLHLNLYKDQITVLLGHNGAGKSTTMSMLTGLYPPTSGNAIVNEFKLKGQLAKVRESLGLCPQHDVLFDQLTVEEHLVFFGVLKGAVRKDLMFDIMNLLEALQLANKRYSLSKNLSGGMKRKLSVAIALIGDSKVVILDEPTSGMDPAARRITWDLLLECKVGRTIMLTTHFMDEADVLGDRIAIMAEGKLQCAGSSLFLKKKYGVGYQLTIATVSGCDVKTLEKEVQSSVAGSYIDRNVGSELVFSLPSDLVKSFQGLFQKLEQNQEQLGIESYGISVTTIEEVFLRVGKLLEDENDDIGANQRLLREHSRSPEETEDDVNTSKSSADIDFQCNDSATKYTSKFSIWYQQFYATLVKRIIHSMRNKKVALTQLLIPAICTSFALLVVKISDNDIESPERQMLLREYGSTITYVTGNEETDTYGAYAGFYEQLVRSEAGSDSVVQRVNIDIQEAAVNLAERSLNDYTNKLTVAAEFTDKIVVWYNNQGYHAAPLSLNLVSNALIIASGVKHTISMSNYPLPQSIDDSAEDLSDIDAVWQGFTAGFNISFGFAFLAASFVIFPVKERSMKSKHLQYVSGLEPIIFWMSAFAWDVVNFLVSSGMLLLLCAFFQVEAYSGVKLLYLTLIFCAYSIPILPLMYSVAFFFEDSVSAFVRCTTLNIVLSVGTLITISILDPDKSSTDTIDWIFVVLIPQYAIPLTMLDLYRNTEAHRFCDEYGGLSDEDCKAVFPTDFDANYFAWDRPGVGRYAVFYLMQGAIWWTVLFFVESNIFQRLRTKVTIARANPRKNTDYSLFGDDDGEQVGFASGGQISYSVASPDIDVRKEASYVKKNCDILRESSTLVVEGLTKTYFLTDSVFGKIQVVEAVREMYLSVSPAECFGLLGINGAGKTTTFKMLTGDIDMTSGTAFIKGLDISSDIKKAQQMMGYCPQFDALIDQMTGKETLRMFARLRGLRSECVEKCVKELIDLLGLTPYANKMTQEYSGGNRRKLSAAIAMIGLPPLVFLDEPTTGMDPAARRSLWKVILHLVEKRSMSVILTSHSMEECEYLCSRLAIMVNGEFKCLGSPQHLKSRFGQGFTLVAKIEYHPENENKRKFHDFVSEQFPNSVLKDEHQTMMQYQVVTPELKWSQVFNTMEENKDSLNIVDYSVSQTSLEQVFLNFARNQSM